MGIAIVITSGKGGVGKTTITTSIGIALANLGKKTILIDGDIGLSNIDILMGLENKIIYNIVDVIENRCELSKAIIQNKNYNNLYFLPTAYNKENKDISSKNILKVINELKNTFDYILIDCPAGIEQGFENSTIGIDEAILVVNTDLTSIRNADRIIGKLETKEILKQHLIINKFDKEAENKNECYKIHEIASTLALKLLGIIPNDKNILICSNKGIPLSLEEKYPSTKSFKNIAERLIGNDINVNKDIKKKNFFKGIK